MLINCIARKKGDQVVDLPGKKGGLAALHVEIDDVEIDKQLEEAAGVDGDMAADPLEVQLRDLRKEKEDK